VIRSAALVAAAAAVLVTSAAAQTPTVEVSGPIGNPITEAAGRFTVRAINFTAEDLPLQLQLQVSAVADFTGPLLADTTVDGPEATIVLPRLLPAGILIYWRAVALTSRAGSFPSAITGPRTVSPHLTLLTPNNRAGQSIATRRPTFTWTSSRVPTPLAPWEFELRVEAAPLNQPVIIARTDDTTFTATLDLEANTSYRWRVIARFPASGESVQVASSSSFVIRSDDAPLATLLYQNFPNPFPSATADRTCLWFDLEDAAAVELDILDLRGQPVRRIIPSTVVRGVLPPGRYGRPSTGSVGGCDPNFTWDGTSESGRAVPPGVYLVRMRAGGTQELRRIVFRGR
jgi:hypothetical protein